MMMTMCAVQVRALLWVLDGEMHVRSGSIVVPCVCRLAMFLICKCRCVRCQGSLMKRIKWILSKYLLRTELSKLLHKVSSEVYGMQIETKEQVLQASFRM